MRVERLSQDKVRIFLTFDDLTERGIQKDDMWRDIPKVHELFNEMMDQAYSEVGFEVSGPVAVEVFALPAQGMVVIVTKGRLEGQQDEETDTDQDEELFELEVTLEESDFIVYRFKDFEYLIQASKSIHPFLEEGGTLYHYKDQYYLFLNPLDMEEKQYGTLIAVLSEFGEASTITPYVLNEYGKIIIEQDAISTLIKHF
jgi:adapter protein MecA 1/2